MWKSLLETRPQPSLLRDPPPWLDRGPPLPGPPFFDECLHVYLLCCPDNPTSKHGSGQHAGCSKLGTCLLLGTRREQTAVVVNQVGDSPHSITVVKRWGHGKDLFRGWHITLTSLLSMGPASCQWISLGSTWMGTNHSFCIVGCVFSSVQWG